ncbi:hypothetical protein ACRRTK_024679 [Alexandromys fortis]
MCGIYRCVCACGGQRSILGVVPQDVHLVLETGSLTGTLGRPRVLLSLPPLDRHYKCKPSRNY